MKSFGIVSLLVINFLFGCKDNESEAYSKEIEGKLPADLVHNPATLDPKTDNQTILGSLQFVDTLHQFGKLKEGEIVSYEFSYTNVGQRPVLIYSARASCGCTVPQYEANSPLAPGQSNKLKVTFNSTGKVGKNRKSILVSSNGNPAEQELFIEAEVE
jgi:hypothetical protein